LRTGIHVEGVVGAGLHAGLAADAALAVEINDAIGSAKEGYGGADLDARGVIAVVAPEDAKVTFSIGKLAFLDVFDPGPIDSNRDIVLFLAGYRAGMTANATVLIDNKTVAHPRVISIRLTMNLAVLYQSRKASVNQQSPQRSANNSLQLKAHTWWLRAIKWD